MKTIYLYLLNTMSDWESGYFLQAMTLQKMLPHAEYRLCTVGPTQDSIKTAGGITMLPDIGLDALDERNAAALLLTGADTWLEAEHQGVLSLAERLLNRDVPVAAICGATLGLAQAGLLDTRRHTSNAPFFLPALAPCYKGAANYLEEDAVLDGSLITAGSAGSLAWAKLILTRLKMYPPETINAWYNYFSTGDAVYYSRLMDTF